MIYITGDTHIPIDTEKLTTKRFPEQKRLTKNDFLIICGDFGGVWCGDNEEKYWRKWFAEKPFTTLFVDGNHENFDMLSTFPTVEFCGGTAHKIQDGLYHLMRGQIFKLDGKTIFTFGGARSQDKDFRKEGKSWWEAELPTPSQITHAKHALDAVNWQVDICITHCAPTSIQNMLKTYPADLLTDFFEELKGKLSYQKWFFGHYHMDKQVDDKHFAVFDSVVKL